MPSNLESWLVWPVLLESSLFGFFALIMLVRAAWIPARVRRLSARLDSARDALFAYLTDPSARRDPVLEQLERLPQPQQLALLGGLSRQLDGLERVRLEALASSLGLVDAAVAACASDTWWKRLQGVRTLLLLGSPSSIPFEMVRDPHALVRAEAVRRWANTPIEGIPHLLALLDDPTPVGRFAVQDALLRIGSPVTRALGEHLVKARPLGLTAAIEVAARLADSSHLKPGLALSYYETFEVRAAAAGLLGALGGAESRERLLHMLEDQSSLVREATLSALAGMGEWSVAPTVARLLRDDEWSVRRRAALSLAHFGSAGKLYLMKASEEPGPAGEMARYALSLPDSALEAS